LVSFAVSQRAINRQLKYAEQYYLKRKEEYFDKPNTPAVLTEFINYISGGLFIVGIIVTVYFVSTNIKGGNAMPSETKKPIFEGAAIPSFQKLSISAERNNATQMSKRAQDAATIPRLQRHETATEKKGAPIPAMQPATTTTQTSQQLNNPQSTQTGTNAGKTK